MSRNLEEITSAGFCFDTDGKKAKTLVITIQTTNQSSQARKLFFCSPTSTSRRLARATLLDPDTRRAVCVQVVAGTHTAAAGGQAEEAVRGHQGDAAAGGGRGGPTGEVHHRVPRLPDRAALQQHQGLKDGKGERQRTDKNE